MTNPEMAVSIVALRPPEFIRRIDELVDIHLQAMDYGRSAHLSRRTLWTSNASQPDFTCSIALLHQATEEPNAADPRQQCLGVAFCFRGTPDSWWYNQVAKGLAQAGHSPAAVAQLLSDYAELSEIHVRPNAQHHGLGRRLLSDVLERTPQTTVMLSTPEVPREDNAAWRLYRSLGFEDLLRSYYFPVDPRPFGILRRATATAPSVRPLT